MTGIRREARLALAAVIVAVIAGSDGNQACAFVGPSVAPGCSAIASPPPLLSSAYTKISGTSLSKTLATPRTAGTATENGTTPAPESLSRRMQARRARSKTRVRTRGTATDSQQRQSTEEWEKGDDVGNLFRIEVAQRLREMKLMTQPGVGPLAPVGGLAGPDSIPLPKSDGDVAALEGQITLLTNRIKSIANHLQTTPTDSVSRKALVVLVKQRRRMLETLRHRGHDRWLAITETLGLRQRKGDGEQQQQQQQEALAARRSRRRDRGRRRRKGE